MLLKVQTPHSIIIKNEIKKVIAEDVEGSFGILPKHIDYVTKLVPSILFYLGENEEGYIAIDEGILVKQKDHVLLSVRQAVEHRELGKLKEAMEKFILESETEGKQLRKEIDKLEIGIVKSFYNLKQGVE